MVKVVYVVGGDHLTTRMFEEQGWIPSGPNGLHLETHRADLICFTGGADVSPYLYGEENISSHCDPIRDEFERQVYESFVGKVPMVGICRGGQFLNVMNGGKMIQHVNGHSYGVHEVVDGDEEPFNTYEVLGDHHQAMISVPIEATHILWSDVNECLWYPSTRCLCFQPHPEWGHEPTRKLFFDLIEEYLCLI